MCLDIDVSSAVKIFKLLDEDQTEEVELEEFVDGLVKYRGSAKMIDLSLLAQEITRTVVSKLDELYERMDRVSSSQPSIDPNILCLSDYFGTV